MEQFMIGEKYAVKTLEKALRIYATSLREKPMAEFLADKCDDLGYDNINIDDVGNLIAKKTCKKRNAPTIILCGHMDVVPGKIKVRRIGNYLYGRGASDAKAPLIAMMLAGASPPDDCNIVFIGAVDEEGSGAGIKHLLQSDFKADYVLFGEPSGSDKITIGYKGRLGIKIRVDVGNSSHASAPWLSGNAIETSMELARQIKTMEQENESVTKASGLTATLTGITGGGSHNITPRICDMTLDLRIPTTSSCDIAESKLSNIVKKFELATGVSIIYSLTDETPAFESDRSSIIVRALTLGGIDNGVHPKPIRKTGTGDMNILGNRWGPVATYGPGDPHEAHTEDEKIRISEYLLGIKILKSGLTHLVRLHDKKKAISPSLQLGKARRKS